MIAIIVEEMFVILYSIHHGHFFARLFASLLGPIVNYEIDISWPNTETQPIDKLLPCSISSSCKTVYQILLFPVYKVKLENVF